MDFDPSEFEQVAQEGLGSEEEEEEEEDEVTIIMYMYMCSIKW